MQSIKGPPRVDRWAIFSAVESTGFPIRSVLAHGTPPPVTGFMKIAPKPSDHEVLAGLVERVTFHNEEHGFCVLRIKARGQRDMITVVGHAAMIAAGEFVQASGTWVNDRTHGVQFRASFLKAAAPTTIEGIEKYLS